MNLFHAVGLCAALALMGGAHAQTPAPNPMPDGSDDMYAGVGVASTPRYAGSSERRARVLPVLQGQWSNGLFVSGLGAGWHLSARPWLEYGPLVALDPGRADGGTGAGVLGIDRLDALNAGMPVPAMAQPLAGLPSIARRVQGGAFLNAYVAPDWRLTSSALYGAGNDHNGATFKLGVQAMAFSPAPHHTVTVTGEVALANAGYNQAFFGIDAAQSARSGNALYEAHGGWRDARIGASWHWLLAPSWLVVSGVDITRQLGATRASPLVTRETGVSVTTALAFRF